MKALTTTLAFSALLTIGSICAEESDNESQTELVRGTKERTMHGIAGTLKAIGAVVSAGAAVYAYYILFFKPPCNHCCPRLKNGISLQLLQVVRLYATFELGQSAYRSFVRAFRKSSRREADLKLLEENIEELLSLVRSAKSLART